ncbi:hypothetical protein GTW25_18835 [Aliihoeflea aestuarii]|uniref:hypothetical protein n=1 Tax=Aliihoeflea aestuarii TaxID=453840 RepID=UPI002094A45F|nr:hypothetical protein [Aliihoeflea aestuarii]MCO6393081.1 hypothetical protein [Aliihoeflea aestuarii]
MARIFAIAACLAALTGCAVYGGAGTATISNDRIDARGAAIGAGVDRSGPYGGTTSGRVVVR